MSTLNIPRLLTAEEFERLRDDGTPRELLRGNVVAMSLPGARHGLACARLAGLLGMHLLDHDIGHGIAGYPQAPPELVFEIKWPEDRWSEVPAKVGEYLAAGVLMVCVLDPQTASAQVYEADAPVRLYGAGETLVFPAWLADWRLPLDRIFE